MSDKLVFFHVAGVLIAKTGGFLYILLMAGGCVTLGGLVVILAKSQTPPESETVIVKADMPIPGSETKTCAIEGVADTACNGDVTEIKLGLLENKNERISKA